MCFVRRLEFCYVHNLFARVLLGALGALGALDVAAPVELAAALPVSGELVRVVAPAAAQHLAPFSPCRIRKKTKDC